MALKTTAKSGGGGDYEKCPLGNHSGVCVAVIGAGTHTQQFAGKEAKDEVKVILVWEVEAEHEGADKRFFILKDFNLYFSEKSNLRKLVEGWFPTKKFAEGEDVDLAKLKGQACALNVADKNGYPSVDAAKPLMKGMTPLKPSVPPFVFDVDEGKPYPAPAWVPYIWGKSMVDYLKESHELGGKKDRPLTENGESATDFPHGANTLSEQAAEAF